MIDGDWGIDHVQMTALSRALKVNVSVAYLDGHVHGEEGKVDFVEFKNVEDPVIEPVTLLYRCGVSFLVT